MPSDRVGFKRKPDWILDRTVGPDEVWRKPDWTRVNYQRPFYQVRCGHPFEFVWLNTDDPDLVNSILRVLPLLRAAESFPIRRDFVRRQARALAEQLRKA